MILYWWKIEMSEWVCISSFNIWWALNFQLCSMLFKQFRIFSNFICMLESCTDSSNEWKSCLIWAPLPPSSDRLAAQISQLQLNLSEERMIDDGDLQHVLSSPRGKKHFNVSSSSFLIIMWLACLLPHSKMFVDLVNISSYKYDGWSSFLNLFFFYSLLHVASAHHHQHRLDFDFHYSNTANNSRREWNYR